MKVCVGVSGRVLAFVALKSAVGRSELICVDAFYFSQCWGHILFMKASVFRNVTLLYFGGNFQHILEKCRRLPENTTSHPSIM